MTDRKWNNQVGSNFDAFSGKSRKPREQPNIPKFSDLDESNSTSFNYKVLAKPKPKLGNFGNEIWTYSPVDDSPAPYVPFVDLTPKDPRIPRIRERTPIPSIPRIDPATSSTDLFPFTVFNEYEIVVKFGTLVLRISSGQAYAARQVLNDPKYDFSIVIKSSNAISLDGNTASTINLISVSNSAQSPIYSLYNWLKTKIAIATNNDATGADSVLSGIDIVENVAQLPSTQFVSNGFTCGLFFAEGIQPDQICLNATNKVFKFEPSVATNPIWTVTYPGEILPLCLDINKLQIVSIKLIPATLNAINRGSGDKFKLRIARDATIPQLASSLKVDVKITSPELILFQQELDPDLYATTGFTDITLGSISVTIPDLEYFTDITIEPLTDATKLVPVPLKVEIISSWEPDSTSDYSINGLFAATNMTVKPGTLLPVVNIRIPETTYSIFTIDPDNFDEEGNPIYIETVYTNVRSSIKQDGELFTVRISRSFATVDPLTVFVDLTASVPLNHFVFLDPITFQQLPIISGIVQLIIPANQLSINYFFKVGSNQFRYQSNQSASGSLRPFAAYDIGLDTLFNVTVLERERFEYRTSVRSGNSFFGGSQQVTFDQPGPNYVLKIGYVGYVDFYSIFSSVYGLIPGLLRIDGFISESTASVTIVSNSSPPSNQQMLDEIVPRGYTNSGTLTSGYQATSINAIFENYIEN